MAEITKEKLVASLGASHDGKYVTPVEAYDAVCGHYQLCADDREIAHTKERASLKNPFKSLR
jgi:hypothetical protein